MQKAIRRSPYHAIEHISRVKDNKSQRRIAIDMSQNEYDKLVDDYTARSDIPPILEGGLEIADVGGGGHRALNKRGTGGIQMSDNAYNSTQAH